MDEYIASVDDVKFDIELFLEQQTGIQPLPFPGMDKSASAVCEFHTKGLCTRGALCPMRHISGEKNVVCKHWLRGLCKKGDDCEFLHEYDMTKMPECYFYSKYGSCNNKECPFLHIDPESKIRDCPWYDRGFCKHGPSCKHRHVRRVLCINYACGFCPEGPKCKFMHPKFDLPLTEDYHKKLSHIICHSCGEAGHKSSFCPHQKDKHKIDPMHVPSTVAGNLTIPTVSIPPGGTQQGHNFQQGTFTGRRPMEFVTCFKCRQKGHYANQCPFSKSELFGQPTARPPRFPPREHFEQQTQSIPTLGSSR